MIKISKNIWGNNFEKISNYLLEKWHLEKRTSLFLNEIGLPLNTKVFNDTIEVNFYKTDNMKIRKNKKYSYLNIGNDFGNEIYICVENSKLFLAQDLDDDTILILTFINEDIEKFILSLQIFQEFQSQYLKNEFEYQKSIINLKYELNKVDLNSFNNESTWWSQVTI